MKNTSFWLIWLLALTLSCKKTNTGGVPENNPDPSPQEVKLFMTKVANNTGYAISEFVFDNKGVLKSIIERDGTYTVYCNSDGQIIKLIKGDIIREFEYDASRRLVKENSRNGTSTGVIAFEYNAGKISRIIYTSKLGGMSKTTVATYTWQNENISLRTTASDSENRREEFIYDEKISPYYIDPKQIHLAHRGEPSSKNNAVKTLIHSSNTGDAVMKKEFKYNNYGYATSWFFLETGYIYGLVFTYKQL